MTVWLAVHCPHSQSTDVKKHGTSSSSKRRYRCLNLGCPYETFSQEIAGQKVASIIANQIYYGANSGAKNSLERNYLSMAEATGHVEIRPLQVVISIEEVRGTLILNWNKTRRKQSSWFPTGCNCCDDNLNYAPASKLTAVRRRVSCGQSLHRSIDYKARRPVKVVVA